MFIIIHFLWAIQWFKHVTVKLTLQTSAAAMVIWLGVDQGSIAMGRLLSSFPGVGGVPYKVLCGEAPPQDPALSIMTGTPSLSFIQITVAFIERKIPPLYAFMTVLWVPLREEPSGTGYYREYPPEAHFISRGHDLHL